MVSTNNLHICHLSIQHRRDDARIFYKECITLKEEGYKVSYIVSDGKGTASLDGINILDIGKFRSTVKRLLFGHITMLIICGRIKGDLYHFHDPELMFLGLMLKLFGKKVIMDVHEDVPRQIIKPNGRNKRLAFFLEQLEKFSARFFDYIIVVSPYLLKRFKGFTHKVEMVCNFPKLTEFPLTVWGHRKENTAVYIGGMTKKRGFMQMLDLIQGTNIRLHLAGSFHKGSGLMKKGQIHPAWKQVIFHGYLSRSDIAQLLSRSTIGLALLEDTPNHDTTYIVKAFEYMASGLPIVMSDLKVMGAIIKKENTGIIVSYDDIPKAQETILALMGNREHLNKMGNNGIKAVKNKYNWQIEKQKLRAVYNSVLQQLPNQNRVS